MSRVILDDELRAKLNGAAARVEVCDPAGKVVLLNQFLPPPMTSEERAAALQEYRDGKCFTTEQVLAHLEQIRRDWESRQ